MVDLLVGDDALGAERAAVVRVVARLDADDLAVGDAQVHAALDAAERAVRRHQRLGQRGPPSAQPTGGAPDRWKS